MKFHSEVRVRELSERVERHKQSVHKEVPSSCAMHVMMHLSAESAAELASKICAVSTASSTLAHFIPTHCGCAEQFRIIFTTHSMHCECARYGFYNNAIG